ncbi:MAG: transporter permease, partial [Cellvibrio sp.]|nr:transporter permease [Cellvibrio sp.]
TVLLIFWAVTSLIIPKLAIDIAANTYPGISTQEFYSRMESDLYTPDRLAAIEQYKQDTLNQYRVTNISDLPFNWAGAELLFGESYSDKVFDKLFSQHTQQLKLQDETYQQLAVLSPLIALQVISSALATTDWRHHQLFTSAAEQYRRGLMQTLNADVGDKQLWDTIPEFSYQPPALPQVIDSYTSALRSIGIWAVFMLVAGGVAIRQLSSEGTA